MSSLGQLNIQLTLDSVQFQQALSKSEHQAQKFVANFVVDMDKAKSAAQKFSQKTTEQLSSIEKSLKSLDLSGDFLFWGNIAKSVGGGAKDLADRYTELSNKLKLVSENELQYAKAMASVYDISIKTAQSTQAVSAVYQSFAQNAKELGINQHQVASVTETISKAVAISGASTSEAQNALTQFSQTLLMGRMRAQEYNSIMTQTPAVMQAIARGLGVTMGQLKEMSDKGELTTDKIIQGLEKSKKSVDELYGKTATTISGAMQNLQTATQKWVGEVDHSLGISDKAVIAAQALAENFDTVAKMATIAGVAIGTLKLTSFIQAQYNSAVATKTEIAAQREKIATLAQETAVRLENTMQSYNANKATMEEIAVTQQRIATEKAKIAVEMQDVSSRAERIALSTQLKALEQQEIQLAQQKIAIDKQQIATKQALKVAYAENAITQSRLTASTIASTTATTVYGRAVAGVKNELNLMKAAALSNPLMTLAMLATTAGSAIWMLSENKKMAREEALRYADSIDQVRANLEQMTKVQVEAELVKVKRSLQEQEAHLESLKQKQKELQTSTQQTVEYIGQEWGGVAVAHKRSTEEIEKAQEDLKLTTAEVEKAQNQLNKTFEIQRDLQSHIPVSELKDRFAELFPNIEQSQIKVDGLNVSLGSFISNVPIASVEALKFAGAVGQIAASAINAAIAVANLAGAQVGNEKLNLHIANNDALIEINKARVSGNTKLANELQAKLNAKNKAEGLGVKEGTKEWEDLVGSELALLNSSPSKSGKTGGSSKKDKLAEKAKRESEKNHENYLNQVAEMSQRLAGLKAEAQEIALFGQPSQYQEVRKLTEDMVINADKYKTIGLEGIEKLQSLATKLDSESQNIAIQKLKFESNEALDAMELGLTLLGKSRTEQELIQFNHQLDLEANRLKQGMTAENIAKLDEEIAKLKERRAIIQAEAEKTRQDPVVGLRAGLAEFADDATNISGQIQNVVTSSLSSMTDSLNTFVMTGKADFRSLAQSILSDINKMIIKMMIFQSIKMAGKAMGFDMSFMGNIGFATGGYTGDGGKYVPAGIVHRGEYVITKEATSRIGLDYLNYLNYGRRGFASGGGVAVPRVPAVNHSFANSGETTNHVTISVNIDKDGNTNASVEQQAQQGKQLGNLIQAKVLEVLAKERRAGGMLAH